jgi:hypothetical protein
MTHFSLCLRSVRPSRNSVNMIFRTAGPGFDPSDHFQLPVNAVLLTVGRSDGRQRNAAHNAMPLIMFA